MAGVVGAASLSKTLFHSLSPLALEHSIIFEGASLGFFREAQSGPSLAVTIRTSASVLGGWGASLFLSPLSLFLTSTTAPFFILYLFSFLCYI